VSADDTDVHVHLMGRFCVSAGQVRLGPDDWPVRRAAELVALLALADGRRTTRDQVVDALWPQLGPDAGAANLRKAAHHARRALCAPDAVVLRGGQVSLFPSRSVTTDVGAFEAAAAAALRSGDPEACAEAATRYGGELLPARALLGVGRSSAGSTCGRGTPRCCAPAVPGSSCCSWNLPTSRPTAPSCGSRSTGTTRTGALRWFGRLRTVLEQDVGVRPGREAQALHDACVEGLRPGRPDAARSPRGAGARRAGAARAAAGEITMLVVRGPGGIGKTALCTALTAVAREQGWVVVPVQALGGTQVRTRRSWTRWSTSWSGRPRSWRPSPARTRSVLAELTPLLLGSPPLDGPVSRHQVVGAVRQVLLAAGGGAPIALVVDDAHLTDDDTATALVHLAGTGGTGRLLVVLAHRPAPDRTSLLDGLARLERAGRSVTVDLAPLSRDDAAALVVLASPERPSADRLARVVDRAAGNPFFLLELAAEPAAAAGGSSGSESLWDAVRHRLVDVDEPARAAVQRLAVVGGELDSAVVVALTGLAEPDALAVLDDAMAAGLLVLHGARYAFRHDLVRQALVAQVPPHRRAAIHRDAATRLGQSGASPHAVARLWLAGERPQEAVPWLAAAAREAVRLGAFHDALSTLDVLLLHAPGHAAALRLRAGALEAVGDARAPAAFAAAALAVPADQRSDLRARQALASIRAGDPAGALTALDGVEARTLEGRLAQSLALAGAAAMGHGDPSVGVVRAAETRRLAIESGDPSAVVIASWAEAAAAHAKGELPGVLRAGLRETWALPEVAITTFDGHLCVAERLLYGGQPYDDVIAFADALEAEADRLGAARGRAFATVPGGGPPADRGPGGRLSGPGARRGPAPCHRCVRRRVARPGAAGPDRRAPRRPARRGRPAGRRARGGS
jgi:DNA-binding SARP family transcriptional activator